MYRKWLELPAPSKEMVAAIQTAAALGSHRPAAAARMGMDLASLGQRPAGLGAPLPPREAQHPAQRGPGCQAEGACQHQISGPGEVKAPSSACFLLSVSFLRGTKGEGAVGGGTAAVVGGSGARPLGPGPRLQGCLCTAAASLSGADSAILGGGHVPACKPRSPATHCCRGARTRQGAALVQQ